MYIMHYAIVFFVNADGLLWNYIILQNYKETYDELQRKESELYKLKKENQELKDSLRERHVCYDFNGRC